MYNKFSGKYKIILLGGKDSKVLMEEVVICYLNSLVVKRLIGFFKCLDKSMVLLN